MRKVIQRKEWDKVYYRSRHKLFQKKIENESLEEETEKVKITLEELKDFGIITSTHYNLDKFLHFRELVHDNFYIIWTAINPPMEHLLFALSEIIKPKNILGLGVFTGNPVVWSMGPAIEGLYDYDHLAAVEINKEHAAFMEENFIKIKFMFFMVKKW